MRCFDRLLPSAACRSVAIVLFTFAMTVPGFCGPIHDAAQSGDLAKVRALLESNPDLVSSKDEQYGATPLFWAVLQGHTDVVELLLTKKADVNFKVNGGTVLYLAVRSGYKDIVKLLLDNHADVNPKTSDGVTPLLLAVDRNSSEIVGLLLGNHADVNVKDNDGITPLHQAALKGYKDLAELLLANGADANALASVPKVEGGGLVVSSTVASGGMPIVEKRNVTPLELAIENGHSDVADLLRQHGGH